MGTGDSLKHLDITSEDLLAQTLAFQQEPTRFLTALAAVEAPQLADPVPT